MEYLFKIAKDYIDSGSIVIVEPSLEGVTRLLREGDIDYVGLRLHCGVIALQHKVRSLVVAVDNRASEISRDTGLPAVARDDLAAIEKWIEGSQAVELSLPFAAIGVWKAQFG
jgi:polysaccharide pyruvyl transferase WcaK-like protein